MFSIKGKEKHPHTIIDLATCNFLRGHPFVEGTDSTLLPDSGKAWVNRISPKSLAKIETSLHGETKAIDYDFLLPFSPRVIKTLHIQQTGYNLLEKDVTVIILSCKNTG